MVSLSKYTLRLVTLSNCDGPAPLLDIISVGFDLSGYKMLNTQRSSKINFMGYLSINMINKYHVYTLPLISWAPFCEFLEQRAIFVHH